MRYWLWLIGVYVDVRRDIDFCLMIDITSLKSQLTDDRIIELMDALGAPLMKKIFIKKHLTNELVYGII